MFTGLVEGTACVTSVEKKNDALSLRLRASERLFNECKRGDSIALQGVCLTVENVFESGDVGFTIGSETLRITGWGSEIIGQEWNFERAMVMGDRLHGHIVTGHVDDSLCVVSKVVRGESLEYRLEYSERFAPYIWSKGSWTLNGVSLTINDVCSIKRTATVCLLPETLKRTNLESLKTGSSVNVEFDWLAKAAYRWFQHARGGNEQHP